MYHDLKRTFWWKGMKKDVGGYVSQCYVGVWEVDFYVDFFSCRILLEKKKFMFGKIVGFFCSWM